LSPPLAENLDPAHDVAPSRMSRSVAAPHQGVPACQGKCSGRNAFALAVALAVKSSNDKLYIKIFWLPLLLRLMTCLCPAMSSGLAPPLV